MKPLLLLLLLVATPAFAQEYVFVFLHHRPDKPVLTKSQTDSLMQGHMANIQKLNREGKLLVAGPFEGGGGLFIFKSASLDSVRAWLAADPGVQANRWRIELLPYTPQVGLPRSVSEPLTMTTCHFVRFVSDSSKQKAADAPILMARHLTYLTALQQFGTVVAIGTFPDAAGGILILKHKPSSTLLEADPAVRSGLLTLSEKSLFIAKGAFGEK